MPDGYGYIGELDTLQAYRANITEAIFRMEDPKLIQEAVLVGSAALQMHGIMLARDIDVVLPTSTLEEIVRQGGHEGGISDLVLHGIGAAGLKDTSSGQILRSRQYEVATRGNVAYMAAPNDSIYSVGYSELRAEAEIIDGVHVSPPARILEWKRAVNRPKDQKAIHLIEDWQKNRHVKVYPEPHYLGRPETAALSPHPSSS